MVAKVLTNYRTKTKALFVANHHAGLGGAGGG